jgi:hypothetical protein
MKKQKEPEMLKGEVPIWTEGHEVSIKTYGYGYGYGLAFNLLAAGYGYNAAEKGAHGRGNKRIAPDSGKTRETPAWAKEKIATADKYKGDTHIDFYVSWNQDFSGDGRDDIDKESSGFGDGAYGVYYDKDDKGGSARIFDLP